MRMCACVVLGARDISFHLLCESHYVQFSSIQVRREFQNNARPHCETRSLGPVHPACRNIAPFAVGCEPYVSYGVEYIDPVPLAGKIQCRPVRPTVYIAPPCFSEQRLNACYSQRLAAPKGLCSGSSSLCALCAKGLAAPKGLCSGSSSLCGFCAKGLAAPKRLATLKVLLRRKACCAKRLASRCGLHPSTLCFMCWVRNGVSNRA